MLDENIVISIRKKSIDVNVEIGEGCTFNVTEEVDGFWISYDTAEFEGWKPQKIDLRWIVKQIKKVMKDLNIQRVART